MATKTQISLRLTKGRLSELDKLCKINDRPRSGVMELLVAAEIERLKKNPSRRLTP